MRALAVDARRVYVGGRFIRVGGVTIRNLAALDQQTGTLVPGWSPPEAFDKNASDSLVSALAVAGRRLFFSTGQSFNNGVPPRPINVIDAATGKPLAWGPKRQQLSDITGLYVVRGYLCAAGVNTPHEASGGCVNITTGHLVSWPWRGPHDGWFPTTFATKGDLLYAAGTDSGPRGMGPNSDVVTALGSADLRTWKKTSWSPTINRWSFINAMAISEDQVLLAGGFSASLG